MARKISNNKTEKEEKQLCQCGSPKETKTIQVGWGSAPISVCTNPDCPEKKKKRKRSASWCD